MALKIPPKYDNPRDRDHWLGGFADSYMCRPMQSDDPAYVSGYDLNEIRKAQAEANLLRVRIQRGSFEWIN